MHKTASTQSFDSETGAQPALPNLMRFPSACSTPVSSSDIIAMENLRMKASAGKGGDRPGRYGENHTQLKACVDECMLVMRNVPSAPHGVRRSQGRPGGLRSCQLLPGPLCTAALAATASAVVGGENCS